MIGAATSTLMFMYQERRYQTRAHGRERAGRTPLHPPSVTGDGAGSAIVGMF